MSEAKLEAYFFTAILLVALLVVGFLFYPFIGSIALAIVLATLVAPFHTLVLQKVKHKSVSAFLVTVLVTCAIILPAIGLVVLLVDEVRNLTEQLSTYDFSLMPSFVAGYEEQFVEMFPFASSMFDFNTIIQDAFENAGAHLTKAITSGANLLLKFFVALIALYYFIKDGKKFLYEIMKLSPLEDSEDVAIVRKLDKVTHSLIRGTLVIAALQGIFVGVGFLLFGVPNPVLWGSVAAVSALIPTLGTGLVSTPAVIYLFMTGSPIAGIGLIAWSMLIVGLVDNIIGPKLIGNGAKIHPLFILLSVLGGLALFGIAGFLLGPLIFGFLVALSEIYKVKIQELHALSE